VNDDDLIAALTDILNDTSGEMELAIRENIPTTQAAIEKLFEEPGMTMGAVAFALATTRTHSELAWIVAVLIRDRIEFGA